MGTVCVAVERRGKTLSVMDSLIVAVTMTNNLALVTRNIDDFVESDLELIDPFDQ